METRRTYRNYSHIPNQKSDKTIKVRTTKAKAGQIAFKINIIMWQAHNIKLWIKNKQEIDNYEKNKIFKKFCLKLIYLDRRANEGFAQGGLEANVEMF